MFIIFIYVLCNATVFAITVSHSPCVVQYRVEFFVAGREGGTKLCFPQLSALICVTNFILFLALVFVLILILVLIF